MSLHHLLVPAALFTLAVVSLGRSDEKPRDSRPSDSRRFVSVRDYKSWTTESGPMPGETVYTSPDLDAGISWNDLVVSWNTPASPERYLKIEAQGVYPDRATKWYTLGLWSDDPARHPRESVTKQKDEDGDVQTDTLVLSRPASRMRLRVTAGGEGAKPPPFLGLSFLDAKADAPSSESGKHAWGTSLDVPQRSQLSYASQGGKVWCSPTSTSMVIGYWSKKLGKPELDRDVPAVAAGVFDKNWPGTGNWPFNTAYAGSLPGMRGYVTRLSGLNEVEEWVKAGVPVVCSVSYRLMYGKGNAEIGGHVVVVTGFTPDGDVIINDPWADFQKGDTVRQTIPRKQMAAACAKSHNTVYLIYPTSTTPPDNRAGHWDSEELTRR